MSSSEIAFLALGLILGGALGAAFLVAAHSGLAPRREVRVTIAPNSIGCRRAATLATPSRFRDQHPLPGSPDDAAWPERPATMTPMMFAARSQATVPVPPMRTRVPVVPDPDPVAAASSVAVAIETAPIAAPGTGAMTATLDVGASPDLFVRPRLPVAPGRPVLASTAVGLAVASDGATKGGAPDPSRTAETSGADPAATAHPAIDPCADPRAMAKERCAAATSARERSQAAAATARDAQRAFDALREQVHRARELSDPRAVDAAKAALREQFRAEDAAAATPDASEAAARRWLHGINQVNADVRAAASLVESGTAEMRERLVALDRLTLEADAARISADGADDECRIAREELARCEEQVAASTPAPTPEAPHPFAGIWPTQPDVTTFRSQESVPEDELAGQSAILRIVRGDRVARDRVVAAVAGADPAAVAEWQIRITALSDAIVARSIEAGYLALPEDHPFWGLFADRERREIVEALASLGFRYDGLGGFADDRVPATRDLSLAVGYAGLDRMRIRSWPREGEIAALYSRAVVAADEWLVWAARDLELGPLMSALGPRAAGLSAIWDAWGRVRPALLATD